MYDVKSAAINMNVNSEQMLMFLMIIVRLILALYDEKN
jgi:hypothetical protein